MAVQLPDFTALGNINPRPNGALPNYPAQDPVAQAEATFGTGVQKAGEALTNVGIYQDYARQKLNESNATLDLVNRLVPLHTQISTETDPNKIAELRQQYDSILQTSGNAIDDPARRQAWMASHAKTILQAHADADKRVTLLDRERVGVDLRTRIDTATRVGANTDDPAGAAATQKAIDDLLEWGQKYGAFTPEQGYVLKKQATRQLITGRIDNLITKGQPDQALALLDQNRDNLDPTTADVLRHKAETRGSGIRVDAAVNRALGRAPPLTSGGMQVGGAIPTRIAEVAQANNIDPTTALTTAAIESRFGQNVGSRGNIFQLGRTEWASVGGGRMGDTDTDIRNGVAFLGQKQQELASALGRDPQPWEIYLAHQQGTGGAVALLSNPDKPAGQVVPAQNISANGGDPSAPSSSFVNKWRATFQRTAARIGGSGTSATAATPDTFDQAIGDSIAVQQVKHGVGGTEAPFKSEGLGPAGATARVGDSPQQVLDRINTLDKVPGTVFLSSGASNNPDQAGFVGDQIDALKAKGAQNIVVPGVGPGVKNAAAVNASLKSVVEEHGGVFFQPDVKWQKDGVHPAEVDKVRQQGLSALAKTTPAAAPDTVQGRPPAATPTAAAAPQPPNRSGLPLPSEVAASIMSDPTLRNDQERYQAMQRYETRYKAEEATQAQLERIKAARQKQAMSDAEDEIVADAYSPNPKFSATMIATDPRFQGYGEQWKRRMIEFINNPPGSGVAAPQSHAAAQSLIDRMRLPEGDPNKITTRDQVYDQIRRLNKDDFNFTLKQFDELASASNDRFKQDLERFYASTRPQIDKSGLLPGLPNDGKGQANAYAFRRMVEDRVAAYRAAGKDPDELINPKSSNYLGSPEALKPYKRNMVDALADFQAEMQGGGGAPISAGLNLKTQDDIVAAYRSGKITRDQAGAELLKRGFATPSAPPASQTIEPAAATPPARPDYLLEQGRP